MNDQQKKIVSGYMIFLIGTKPQLSNKEVIAAVERDIDFASKHDASGMLSVLKRHSEISCVNGHSSLI